MITVVDYGLGNVNAIINAYKRIHIDVKTAQTADELQGATKLILPGVGHFDYAMTQLNNSGMRNVLDKLVLKNKVPILGICVGMQIMGNRSEEGVEDGLGWINADVKKIDISKIIHQTKLPHMGWNGVNCKIKNELFNLIDKDALFYFLHSFYIKCVNDQEVAATTDYAGVFASSVKSDNIYGVQFHPEKSHHCGEILLHNFAKL